MKKLIFLIVCFISVCLLTVIIAFSSSAIVPYHWAIDPVDFTINQGILEGTRSTFDPDVSISRGQFARALAKIGGGPTSGTAYTGFTDVPSTHYYAAPIKWCKDRGIVFGTSPTTFDPFGDVTREQACAFIYRYCNSRSVSLTPEREMINFSDYYSITENMRPAVTALCRARMINGYDDNTFRPKNRMLKCEAALVLSYLDCREYNNDNTIVLYVKSYNGAAIANAAVYVVPPSSTESITYTPILSLGSAPGKGIARYEGLDRNKTYGLNIYTKYTMVSVQDLKSPARKYVYATIPKNISDATNIPFDGYNRSHWPHIDGQCNEPRWAYNDGFCPTCQRRRNQNFGWRYLSGREFHQGLDFSCYRKEVKNISDVTGIVVDYGDNPNSATGLYVQIQAGGKYFTYQHLESIKSIMKESPPPSVAKGQIIGVSGNTGIGTGYHLHITVATIQRLAPASAAERTKYLDPRIYID